MLLIATCDRALEAFQAPDSLADGDFVLDLERMITRSHRELEALNARAADSS